MQLTRKREESVEGNEEGGKIGSMEERKTEGKKWEEEKIKEAGRERGREGSKRRGGWRLEGKEQKGHQRRKRSDKSVRSIDVERRKMREREKKGREVHNKEEG